MRRPAALALACLAAVLLPIPMVLAKPGWPMGLKADEPAYWLMAESLAHDFDLVLGEADRRRAFEAFPYGPIGNLIVMSSDGFTTLQYGKPYIYSLLAAPFTRFLGANGPLTLNMLLYLGMVWLGFRYLARYNSEGVAAMTSAGFFLLSVGFAYVFWIHPEVLNMASAMACLYLGLTASASPTKGRWRRWLAEPAVRAALSGAALVPAVYNKPVLALLGLPVLLQFLYRRRWAGAGWWMGGAVAGMALVVGIFWGLTGHVTPYLGVARGGLELCSPHQPPASPEPELLLAADGTEEEGSLATVEEAAATEPPAPPRASWWWIFHLPRLDPLELAERFSYFLWGRHTGLFLYFPFTLLALGLFLAHERRSGLRWGVLAATAGVGLFFVLWISDNWHGGGGFLGNRYFVNAYPAFLFLVTRVTPFWLPLAGYALGGLLLGPLLFSPFGRGVPWPTLQAHVRNAPFTYFPLELSLRNVPGYELRDWGGVQLRGRRDQFLPQGERFWIHGATRAELWLQSWEPLGPVAFQVGSHAAPNEVVVRLGRERKVLSFPEADGGASRTVHFSAPRPTRVRRVHGHRYYAYRLNVTSATGEVRPWTQVYPPQECDYFPQWDSAEESFYVGTEMVFIGDPEVLERSIYGVEWLRVAAPEQVVAGERFPVRLRVRNTSGAEWPAEPPIRVQLSYHWEQPDGEAVIWEGLRTPIVTPLPAGEEVARSMMVEPPAEPGDYILVLDLLLEGVAWFSQRGAPTPRVAIEVLRP
jgi:hypothetical protein